MLVPAEKVDEAAAIAAAVAAHFPVGDPTQPTSVLGPLVNANQLGRVRGYIEKGVSEGATAVVDGRETGLASGYFVGPTVFANVTEDMTIAREEIFGPVLSIMGYKDEADAVRIANGTEYGLAGGVWSGDPDRADRVARQLRAGQVEVNGGAVQHECAVRWVQAVGRRARGRHVRARRVPRDQGDSAIVCSRMAMLPYQVREHRHFCTRIRTWRHPNAEPRCSPGGSGRRRRSRTCSPRRDACAASSPDAVWMPAAMPAAAAASRIVVSAASNSASTAGSLECAPPTAIRRSDGPT